MTEWIKSALDAVLILTVVVGIAQAVRLIRQLAGLKQGRIDMERFVHEFNSTVLRAEAGIKNLKQTTRDSGDDLEKLLDKAIMVRDELRFIVDSADQLANRLTESAATVMKPDIKTNIKSSQDSQFEAKSTNVSPLVPIAKIETQTEPSSRAEKELLLALQKLK